MDDEEWTVERHMLAGTPETVGLWERFEEILQGFGPITLTVAKTTVTFKGSRRGFAGARPTKQGLVGYLDLLHALPPDPRVRSVAPYGRNLFVNHWQIKHLDEFDPTFVGWLHEGYEVGCGAHLSGRL